MIDRRIGTSCVLGLALLLPALDGGPARAGSPAGEPGFEWIFSNYEYDGAGGFTGPFEVSSGEQTGGVLDERETLNANGIDHLRVFSAEGPDDFWASARAPLALSEDAGTVVGGRSEMTVRQVFRKDLTDAELHFTIEDSLLNVRDFRFDPSRGLRAIVHHRVEAGAFFTLDEEAILDGYGGDWTFEENGTEVLPYVLVNGALDEASAVFAFSAPFEQEIDLAAVPDGEEFTVTYRLIADAVDTSNAKSLALAAAGFDGEHLNTAISFEFTGLTPIGVPEPGGPVLVVTGAAALAAARRMRRGRAAPSIAS